LLALLGPDKTNVVARFDHGEVEPNVALRLAKSFPEVATAEKRTADGAPDAGIRSEYQKIGRNGSLSAPDQLRSSRPRAALAVGSLALGVTDPVSGRYLGESTHQNEPDAPVKVNACPKVVGTFRRPPPSRRATGR